MRDGRWPFAAALLEGVRSSAAASRHQLTGSAFIRNMKDLLARLQETYPFFVRCVRRTTSSIFLSVKS